MTFTVLKTMLSHTVSVLSSPLRGDRRGAGSKADATGVKELQLDAKEGIYFMHLFDSTNETQYKQKIIIQK
jgi:hypothetical protein